MRTPKEILMVSAIWQWMAQGQKSAYLPLWTTGPEPCLLSIFSETMSANQQPTIAAAHAATMAQQQRADNTRGWQSATGNPIFNNIQPPNPNVIPNPTIQQMETIEKAIKILNNHQLLMKFATENKQVSETELVDQI